MAKYDRNFFKREVNLCDDSGQVSHSPPTKRPSYPEEPYKEPVLSSSSSGYDEGLAFGSTPDNNKQTMSTKEGGQNPGSESRSSTDLKELGLNLHPTERSKSAVHSPDTARSTDHKSDSELTNVKRDSTYPPRPSKHTQIYTSYPAHLVDVQHTIDLGFEVTEKV